MRNIAALATFLFRGRSLRCRVPANWLTSMNSMWKTLIRIGGLVSALLTWLLFCACADPSHADENLVISEVMAVNRRTLADQDGEYSDWIEIFNPNSSAVSLEGWYLTDDPNVLNKWRLPAAKIKGNGYVVVFASQKDRQAAGAELHTNFKLDHHGGFLALVKPDGATISFQFVPGYPAQVTDVSYGIDPTAGPVPLSSADHTSAGTGLSVDQSRYFTHPTPGSRNKEGVSGLAP